MAITAHLIGGPKDGETYALPEPVPMIRFQVLRALDLGETEVGPIETEQMYYIRKSIPRDTDTYDYIHVP